MSTDRLVVHCWGGLGNQLFEYAAGLYFSKRTGRSLELIRTLPQNESWNGYSRPFQLQCFSISQQPRLPGFVDRLFLSTNRKAQRASALLSGLLRSSVETETKAYHFDPTLLDNRQERTIYLNGFWQSVAYVNSSERLLRQELTLTHEPAGPNAEYARKISSLECPVSIHLRLGDYSIIKNLGADGKQRSMVLPLSYYREAISMFHERFPRHTLVVFSDDTSAARQLVQNEPNVLFIEGNGAEKAYEDMRLMSMCRHHVIANSSFSWWGAWLNPRDDKEVIAPKFWGNSPETHYPDLYPERWITLSNLEP